MPKIVWVIVKTNNLREAQKIGRAALGRRLVACYDILPRIKGEYFWPPKKTKIQTSHGPNLILETLARNVQPLKTLIKKQHSDQLPFIGILKLEMEHNFYHWLKHEIK